MSANKHKYNQEMKDDFFRDGKGKSVVKYKQTKGKYKSYLGVPLEWLDDTQDDREGKIELALLTYTNNLGTQ